jgi:hypothetical protein
MISVSDESEIETKVGFLVQKAADLTELESKLNLIENPTHVSVLLRSEAICESVCEHLKISESGEIEGTLVDLLKCNAEMNEIEGQMMIQLGVLSPESLVGELTNISTKISNQSALLETICTKLNLRDDSEIVEKLEFLLQVEKLCEELNEFLDSADLRSSVHSLHTNHCELESFLSKLCAKLSISSYLSIPVAVDSLLCERELLGTLNSLFPKNYDSKDVKENVLRLLCENNDANNLIARISELLGCDDVAESIEKLKRDISLASRLVSGLLSVFLSPEVTFSFPISENVEERISKMIEQFKEEVTVEKQQRDVIFTRASHFGFRGSDLSDAVDVIITACNDVERHNFHEELMEVRAANEKEKLLHEKIQSRLQRKIEALKSRDSEL